jgi:predicted nucleic acid-binding protein
VIEASQSLGQVEIVTTEEVLTEVLAFYSKAGFRMRQRTVNFIKNMFINQNVQIIEQNHQSFILGFALYENRLDKGYSLTDCISMNVMKQLNITEILSHDRHFNQEGFVILFED